MKFLFLITFIFFTAKASAQWRVSNNGEGLFIDGKLYLLDLVEENTHLTPFDGSDYDPLILQRVLNSPILGTLKVNPVILAKKLTHLNSVSPHFGDVTLEVLFLYQWKLAPAHEIPLVPRPGEQEGHIALAYRKFHDVKVNQPAWFQLDEIQRVALVLHEALSGLAKLKCGVLYTCIQDATPVRKVVGHLFSSRYNDDLSIYSDAINLEDFTNACDSPKAQFAIYEISQFRMKKMLKIKSQGDFISQKAHIQELFCGPDSNKSPITIEINIKYSFANISLEFFRQTISSDLSPTSRVLTCPIVKTITKNYTFSAPIEPNKDCFSRVSKALEQFEMDFDLKKSELPIQRLCGA